MTSIVSKDKDFLQCFWDLALDNSNARVAASARLIEFVKKNLETERDYALKRLIKGLGSSRDCARHGFATCLTEFLHLPGVSVEHTLEILDNSTKVTGSLKGAEERDFLFSKLFCIMAIIRSKKTVDNKEEHMNLLDRLLELHEQKGWMREVVVEALLLFCSSLTDTAMVNATILKVKTLVSTPIVDMAAWQLSFCIGLAQLQSATHKDGAKIAAVWQKEWKKEAAELEVCKTPLTMDNIESLKDTLLAATAGYPKIHRVWEYLVSFVVPMDANRELVASRADALTSSQEIALQQLVQFLDAHLLSASNEKRGVALHITTLLVQRVPADCLPLALSAATVNLLRLAKSNKAHTLHALAGSVLDRIVAAAGDDVSSKLALVSAFTQYGGANFDTLTSTQTISSLLAGFSYEAVVAHAHVLVGVVAAFPSASAKGGKAGRGGEEDSDEEEEGDESSDADSDAELLQLSDAISALDALLSLTRNANIAHRGLVSCTVAAVLARLAVFGTGAAQLGKEPTKSDKKGGKKRKSSAGDLGEATPDLTTVEGYYAAVSAALAGKTDLPLPPAAVAAVKILDATLAGTEIPESLAAAAGTKLLSLLADLGNFTLTFLDTPPQKDADKAEGATEAETAKPSADATPTLSAVAWQALWQMHSSGLPLGVVESDEEGTWEDAAGLLNSINVMLKTDVTISAAAAEEGNRAAVLGGRLADALHGLVAQTAFHSLVSGSVDVQTLEGLVAVLPTLLSPPAEGAADASDNASAASGDDEEAGDAYSRALMHLFEVSLDLLSLNADQHQATRGLRDGVKKVWQGVCALQGSSISVDVIDSIVAAVIGEEQSAQDEEDGEEGDNNSDNGSAEGSPEEGDSDVEMDVEESPAPKGKAAKAAAKNSARAQDEDSDEEEEDVVISEEAAFDMLTEGADGGSDDEDGPLQHSAEVDDALAQMIALKQQSRKAGVLQAHKQALLVRSRSIDILEIVVNKIDRGVLLFPLFQPLLHSLGVAYNSLTTQSIAEGTTYCNRLQNLVEQKLCKKKISLGSEDCTPEEVLEEFQPLSALLLKHLNSQLVPLRHVAQATFLTVARSVWSSGSAPGRQLLVECVQKLFSTYSTKKNTRISLKLIEDLVVNRLSDIVVPIVWTDLVTQMGAVQHSFLRSELTHLFTAVLKKYHGLAPEAQLAVRAGLAGGLSALSTQLTAQFTENGGKDSSQKKLKALLAEVKEASDFLKKAVPVTGAKEGASSKTVVFESLLAVRAAVTALEAAVSEGVQRLESATAKTDKTEGEADTAATDKAGKAGKGSKHAGNSVVGQLKAIQSTLAAFLEATAAAAQAASAAAPGTAKKSKGDKKATAAVPTTPATSGKAAKRKESESSEISAPTPVASAVTPAASGKKAKKTK